MADSYFLSAFIFSVWDEYLRVLFVGNLLYLILQVPILWKESADWRKCYILPCVALLGENVSFYLVFWLFWSLWALRGKSSKDNLSRSIFWVQECLLMETKATLKIHPTKSIFLKVQKWEEEKNSTLKIRFWVVCNKVCTERIWLHFIAQLRWN